MYYSRCLSINIEDILGLFDSWHVNHVTSEGEGPLTRPLVTVKGLHQLSGPVQPREAGGKCSLNNLHLSRVDHLFASKSPARPLLRLPPEPLSVPVVDVDGVDGLELVGLGRHHHGLPRQHQLDVALGPGRLVAPMSAAKSSDPNTRATGHRTEPGLEERFQASLQMMSISRRDLAVSINMINPMVPRFVPTTFSVMFQTNSSSSLSLTLGKCIEEGRFSPPRIVSRSF